MKTKQSLRIPAEIDKLDVVRDFVERNVKAFGADEITTFNLVLSVDEAVSNIIVHGYQNIPGNLDIDIGKRGAKLTVRIRDDAPHFDPTQVPIPDLTIPLEERSEGGLGVFFIRQLTDKVDHRITRDGKNELIMTKIISGGKAG